MADIENLVNNVTPPITDDEYKELIAKLLESGDVRVYPEDEELWQ